RGSYVSVLSSSVKPTLIQLHLVVLPFVVISDFRPGF
ncbi:unnamed protein product, partial [Brassica oleracea]